MQDKIVKTWHWQIDQFTEGEVTLSTTRITFGELGPRDLGWSDSISFSDFYANDQKIPKLDVPRRVMKELNPQVKQLAPSNVEVPARQSLTSKEVTTRPPIKLRDKSIITGVSSAGEWIRALKERHPEIKLSSFRSLPDDVMTANFHAPFIMSEALMRQAEGYGARIILIKNAVYILDFAGERLWLSSETIEQSNEDKVRALKSELTQPTKRRPLRFNKIELRRLIRAIKPDSFLGAAGLFGGVFLYCLVLGALFLAALDSIPKCWRELTGDSEHAGAKLRDVVVEELMERDPKRYTISRTGHCDIFQIFEFSFNNRIVQGRRQIGFYEDCVAGPEGSDILSHKNDILTKMPIGSEVEIYFFPWKLTDVGFKTDNIGSVAEGVFSILFYGLSILVFALPPLIFFLIKLKTLFV